MADDRDNKSASIGSPAYAGRQGWPLCPMCAAHDTFDIDPTEQGELFHCSECGHTWREPPPQTASPLSPIARSPLAASVVSQKFVVAPRAARRPDGKA